MFDVDELALALQPSLALSSQDGLVEIAVVYFCFPIGAYLRSTTTACWTITIYQPIGAWRTSCACSS